MNAMIGKRRKGAICLLAAAVLCLTAAGCTKPAEDAPAQTPPSIVFPDDSYLRGQIDSKVFDVDGDGIQETCSLDYGPTSGVFSFFFSVYQDGVLEYRSLFTASHGELSFVTLEGGATGIQLIPNREGAAPIVHDIRFVDGVLLLNADTETVMPAADYPYTLAYVGGIDPEVMNAGALNRDAISINSARHLPIFRLDTAKDLEQFRLNYIGTAISGNSWDEVASFNEATAPYDKTFFRDNSLLLVYVSSGNCTQRFGLHSIDLDGTSLCVRLQETTGGEILSELDAAWLVIIEIPDSLIADCTEFDAHLGDR